MPTTCGNPIPPKKSWAKRHRKGLTYTCGMTRISTHPDMNQFAAIFWWLLQMHVLRSTWCSSDIMTISDYCIWCFSHKPWGFLRTASFWHGKREVCFVNVGCCKRSSNLNFTSSACCLLITSYSVFPPQMKSPNSAFQVGNLDDPQKHQGNPLNLWIRPSVIGTCGGLWLERRP